MLILIKIKLDNLDRHFTTSLSKEPSSSSSTELELVLVFAIASQIDIRLAYIKPPMEVAFFLKKKTLWKFNIKFALDSKCASLIN